jgi:hypothetical protein
LTVKAAANRPEWTGEVTILNEAAGSAKQNPFAVV